MDIYGEVRRHLDAWDMADGMVRQIAWTPRWIPELQREAMLIERLFYPEKWIFQRHQLSGCDPRQGGIGNMVNCGAAMYIAPIGVVNACDPKRRLRRGHRLRRGPPAELRARGGRRDGRRGRRGLRARHHIEADRRARRSALAKDGTRAAIAAIAEAARGLARRRARPCRGGRTPSTRSSRAISPMGDDVNHSADKAGVPTDAYQPSRLHAIEELPLALGFCARQRRRFPQVDRGRHQLRPRHRLHRRHGRRHPRRHARRRRHRRGRIARSSTAPTASTSPPRPTASPTIAADILAADRARADASRTRRDSLFAAAPTDNVVDL